MKKAKQIYNDKIKNIESLKVLNNKNFYEHYIIIFIDTLVINDLFQNMNFEIEK